VSEFSAQVGQIAQWALAGHHRIVTAESCTGGWIAKEFTDLPGSSRWFECGFVTYSNEAKMRELSVAARTLEEHGAVSEATVREMAAGALARAGVDVAIAVSGVAGPDGGSAEKPVGTVWFCLAHKHGQMSPVELVTDGQLFGGDRDAIRRLAVRHGLQLLLRRANA
jgi:nicotinamide-nucleotide amidase